MFHQRNAIGAMGSINRISHSASGNQSWIPGGGLWLSNQAEETSSRGKQHVNAVLLS